MTKTNHSTQRVTKRAPRLAKRAEWIAHRRAEEEAARARPAPSALVPLYDCPRLHARIMERQCAINRRLHVPRRVEVDFLEACRECPGVVALSGGTPAAYVRARIRTRITIPPLPVPKWRERGESAEL